MNKDKIDQSVKKAKIVFGLLSKSINHIIDSFLKSIFVKGRFFKSIFESRL
jgi:hypothetical protein